MALVVSNPIEIKIVFSDEGGTIDVDTSAHFTYTAEEYPDCSARKGIPIVHTSAQIAQIKSFASAVWLPQIEASL